jgi:hypothetical protein
MERSISVLLCLAMSGLGCSREPPPRTAQNTSTLPTQTALVAPPTPSAEPSTLPIPTNIPNVAPPVAPPARAPEEVRLTPSSGMGVPRPVAAGLVPSDPALDKTESTEDQESVGEIRALLAADPSLSASARQVTIVARKGRIWLRGQVNTPAERAAIERAARKAANVRDVRNELLVLE